MIEWKPIGPDDVPGDDLEPLQRGRANARRWRTVLEIPALLVIAAVIALVVKAFLAQAFFIPSASMESQLTAGDRVIVSRVSYRLHEPRRGDVIVFDDPSFVAPSKGDALPFRVAREALEALGVVRPDGKELIKRVVALPGETVAARHGVIVVDGRALIEPYLDEGTIIVDFPPVKIPEDHLFVMGDNRTNSKDSRIFGPIDEDLVVGRAIARLWPPGRIAFL